MASQKLISVDYEVHGKVQGVFFRKYTQEEAKKLQLVGWVQNTARGTVVGTVQGPEDRVQRMKDWLQYKGSPMSSIDRCCFSNLKELNKLDFSRFKVKETYY